MSRETIKQRIAAVRARIQQKQNEVNKPLCDEIEKNLVAIESFLRFFISSAKIQPVLLTLDWTLRGLESQTNFHTKSMLGKVQAIAPKAIFAAFNDAEPLEKFQEEMKLLRLFSPFLITMIKAHTLSSREFLSFCRSEMLKNDLPAEFKDAFHQRVSLSEKSLADVENFISFIVGVALGSVIFTAGMTSIILFISMIGIAVSSVDLKSLKNGFVWSRDHVTDFFLTTNQEPNLAATATANRATL